MDLNHLHLAVKDLEKSMNFYTKAFDFYEKARFGPSLVFLKNNEGFDLALSLVDEVEQLPNHIHYGFSFKTKSELMDFYTKGQRVFSSNFVEAPSDKGGFVSFVCVDPDGYHIELYWDPNLS
tara:strand:+ start:14303 stop:14668 length:366 start_codon:yes stop_codon:yes gene_type:complete